MADMGFEARQADLSVCTPNQERDKKKNKMITAHVEKGSLENFIILLKVEENN